MSVCVHCRREIPPAERRLRVEGAIAWTASAEGTRGAARDEHVLEGAADFCSIRCLGTFIGVTLERRGLAPPKPRSA